MNLNYSFIYLIAVLLFTALWAFPAGLVANTARLKGRTWASFYTLGLVISWLVIASTVAIISRTRHISELRVCSVCCERIGKDSSVCGHCGSTQTPRSDWKDQQILSRIRNQRIFGLLALGSASLTLVFLVILVNFPAAPISTDFPDAEAYLAALALHVNTYTLSWSALIACSLTFSISAGAWTARELGHPAARPKITGEPFFSTKVTKDV